VLTPPLPCLSCATLDLSLLICRMEIIHPLQQAAGRQQEGEAVRVLACYRLSKGLQTTVGHFVNKVLLEHSHILS
jgi:hypothetical protein